MMQIKKSALWCLWFAILALCLTGCTVTKGTGDTASGTIQEAGTDGAVSASDSGIPPYSGKAYVAVNGNQPEFDEKDMTEKSFETYADLDQLGRCGVAYANIGRDLMPEGKRGNIGPVKPSGWHITKYDNVEGKYLYNRCHLIGFQLSGENANERNLITGTRYLNMEGMLPFENHVADYVKKTGNHVLYRVTPVYQGDNLVADGVHMEAKSVEDEGKGICFHVYVYNVQPGIEIDYATGESRLVEQKDSSVSDGEEKSKVENKKEIGTKYVLNTNTHKYHKPYCSSVEEMKEKNKKISTESKEAIEKQGYMPCGRCKP